MLLACEDGHNFAARNDPGTLFSDTGQGLWHSGEGQKRA
jgi:hypothetical protein